jgi:hypothetical protein
MISETNSQPEQIHDVVPQVTVEFALGECLVPSHTIHGYSVLTYGITE